MAVWSILIHDSSQALHFSSSPENWNLGENGPFNPPPLSHLTTGLGASSGFPSLVHLHGYFFSELFGIAQGS